MVGTDGLEVRRTGSIQPLVGLTKPLYIYGVLFRKQPTQPTKHSNMKTLLLLLAALVAPSLAFDGSLASGSGRFELNRAGKTVAVWYFLPDAADFHTPILFVMHGVKRDAERYRDEWIPMANKHGFMIVSPEFSRVDFPKDSDYSQGSVVDSLGKPRPRDETAFSFIEPIFDRVKLETNNRSSSYQLYGHSAGAQFAHRFLYFEPNTRVSRVVAANAGWWTLPDNTIDFPFGLKGAPGVTNEVLEAVLRRPLVVLLGTKDVDPNDVNLNKSQGAMQQGEHRFARGNTFYESGQSQAKAKGIKIEWTLSTAPGIAHSDRGMSIFAADLLFSNR